MFRYTIGRMNKMCYGRSTGAVQWLAYEMVGAVQWLAYEMVEKNNIKGNVR